MKQSRLLAMVLSVLLLLSTTACDIIQFNDGVVTVNVGISESTVNSIIDRTLASGQDTGNDFLFQQITGVDLIEPNTVRVFGNFDQNGAPVVGSYDLTVATTDGRLQMQVARVDVPGVGVDDPRVQAANSALARAFQQQAQGEADGRFTSVQVIDGELRFSIEAPLNLQP